MPRVKRGLVGGFEKTLNLSSSLFLVCFSFSFFEFRLCSETKNACCLLFVSRALGVGVAVMAFSWQNNDGGNDSTSRLRKYVRWILSSRIFWLRYIQVAFFGFLL